MNDKYLISTSPQDLPNLINRKWAVDVISKARSSNSLNQLISKSNAASDLPNPIGFLDRFFSAPTPKSTDSNLKVKRGWDIALEPLKSIPMNLFILWMSGNSISIFPIMMVMMMFMRPLQAIFTFKKIEGDQAYLQCFVFFLGNLAVLGSAIMKFHTMGLLPTYSSDWLAFVEQSPQDLSIVVKLTASKMGSSVPN